MFPAVCPDCLPASVCHTLDKVFFTATVFFGFKDSYGAFGNIALFRIIDQKIVFILVPGDNLTFLDRCSIKMFPLFSDSQTFFKTEIIGKFFLMLQIMFCLMKLTSVYIGNRIGNNVNMKMVFVLMYADQILMIRKEVLGKSASNLETFFRSDFFIFMKTDNVVCVHSAGVFVPHFFLFEESAVNMIPINCFIGIRTCDFYKSFNDFLILKDVVNHISHRSV